MTRKDLLPYVSFAVDDALADRTGEPIPEHARIVGWQCGFEPLCVAVWSYLPGCRVEVDDAADLALDLLVERGWFAGESPREADFVL